MTPRWEILVATLGQRSDRFSRLLGRLSPQLNLARGQVVLTALWNRGERPIGEVRQDLLTGATGDYVSFVDDDDEVPTDFISTVLPLLDGVDYVGWRMQCVLDGVHLKPTYHSLAYSRWYDDPAGYYRDVSHLNPVRRELALLGDYRRALPEDVDWAAQVRPYVRTENVVDPSKIMYTYRASSRDSTWRGGDAILAGDWLRPALPSRYMRYHVNSSV